MIFPCVDVCEVTEVCEKQIDLWNLFFWTLLVYLCAKTLSCVSTIRIKHKHWPTQHQNERCLSVLELSLAILLFELRRTMCFAYQVLVVLWAQHLHTVHGPMMPHILSFKWLASMTNSLQSNFERLVQCSSFKNGSPKRSQTSSLCSIFASKHLVSKILITLQPGFKVTMSG